MTIPELDEAAVNEITLRSHRMLTSEWALPIRFRMEGGSMVGSIEIAIGIDLSEGLHPDMAKRLIREAIQNAIIGTMQTGHEGETIQ